VKPQTRRQLDDLSRRTGKEYGKLVQKLLAIAFLETGAEHLVESSIQGIDLEVRIAGVEHAFEVKTCEGRGITLGKKDVADLTGHLQRGEAVYIAMLASGLFDDWIFARLKSGELPSGRKLSAFKLRPYRNRQLEQRICAAFESAVKRFGEAATTERQRRLDQILARYPAHQLA